MSRIRVQNFGPLRHNENWIDVNKVTLLIGNQGSGKSTVAKLISTFTWIEKALNRGDYTIKNLERKSKFKNTFLSYHRIQNYLRVNTIIEYIGESYNFIFKDGSLHITKSKVMSELPQIMYVPAERNFLTYIETFKELKVSSPSLREFRDEYKNAQKNIKGQYKLPIADANLEYDRQNDILHLRGNDYKLRISETSSGYQSFIPLYIVSYNLSQSVLAKSEHAPMSEDERERFKKLVLDIVNNKKFTEEQRRSAISALPTRFNKSSFINIVEEPEQNLFPTSQWKVLACLLQMNNTCENNQLIMTSHSPYIINYLTLFVKAHSIKQNIDIQQIKALENVVPEGSYIHPEQLSIYEFDDVTGEYRLLDNYKGMPSDENLLNNGLVDTNEKFTQLLELEELCK